MEIDAHLLCSLRERRGKSQRDLAKEVKVSQRTISRWESGAERCHPKYWDRIEAAFGIKIDQLFSSELRDDIIDELVERGVTSTMANSMYDSSIGPMIQDRLAQYDDRPANADKILQMVIDNWAKLSDSQKLQMIAMIQEIKNR